MIEYELEVAIKKKPVVITCDVCKHEFNYAYEIDQIQEFHHIHFTGGYASIFGDGVTMKADICQSCLAKLLGDYLVTQEED